MCGFIAEFTFNAYDLTHSNSFEELLLLSKHRGPDATLIGDVKIINWALTGYP